MTTKSRSRGGNSDLKVLMSKLTHHLSLGTLRELFEDDYFVTDIIKTLYEDGLDSHKKQEILSLIEQIGSRWLNKNSVDQVITALTDIFSDAYKNPGATNFTSQLLITITTIFIDHDELLESELCTNFISILMDLLKKVNVVASRRLRAMACHCLGQIESWKSGVLWKWKDMLTKLAREERTDICQDYTQLLVTIMNSSLEDSTSNMEGTDILPVVSFAMENSSYLTTDGILAILCPVIKLVQSSERISPTVFKPLMLQHLPCNDLNVMCLMLHIQNHFRGEILSLTEEKILLGRIAQYINHAKFSNNSRLLAVQWISSFVNQHKTKDILNFLIPSTSPSVFQHLDLHTCWLALHSICKTEDDGQNVSRDLHYLTQLAETTGGIRVTCALYYLLYLRVCHLGSDAVHATSLRITKNLFQSFSHLIPLIVDFLQAVKTSRPETMFHGEILNLLHKTVLSLPLNSLLSNYQNYLQVWILSAQDPTMHQQKQLRRLLELVQEASSQAADDWILGSLILSICRSMMLHHHTDTFYPQMGDLLYFMMHHYGDLDTQDHARYYYALLTMSSDDKTKEILSADLMEGLQLGENIANMFPGSVVQALPSDIREIEQSPIVLNRSQISIIFEESDLKDSSYDVSGGFIERYRGHLLNIKTHVDCQYSASIVKETDYNDLIAVSFHICDDKKTSLCEDVNVSFMLKGDKTDVKFKFKIDLPKPIALYPSVIFSHDRTTFQSSLDPLQLELEDFLVPFPWHLFDFDDKSQLFDAIWQECTVGSSGICQGVESVKILKCKQKDICQKWKEALVIEESDYSHEKIVNKRTACYLFFMPPSYHLLFKAEARVSDTVIRIASDFPAIFGFLDDYLDTFSSL